MIPLVAVAHGSRDPRSAATVRALARRVSAAAPELDVRVSFLDLSEPLVTDVLRDLVREGHRSAVVVPLLLGSAFHARVDLPALVAQVPGLRVTIADVLGAALSDVAFDRLAAVADVDDPSLGVVLAAVGSSRAAANEAVASLARSWQARHGFRAVAAFASAAKPDVPAAMAKLRARGARRIGVASWFLAPGLLPDRIASQARAVDPSVALAAPLADDPRVAELVLERYATALAGAVRSA
ncbi:sirohydrochlorin chelatase [Amycolatopsis endophytica]|uniref:Sirohydrochlorin ferrochelatase n=1 Tax=Amycolatopsis endophytica TaxID=860233 RepID=A0A853BEC3_9PSEU|nr:sirohydrochlorin chelatase [Amycolatopsis endophytica]NYI93609.1 sirohydrochlorin ferrochelatase [Amycolatopsis endophytica]